MVSHPDLLKAVREACAAGDLEPSIEPVQVLASPVAGLPEHHIEQLVAVDLAVLPQPVPDEYELLAALLRGARVPLHLYEDEPALVRVLEHVTAALRRRTARWRDEAEVAERGYSLNGIGMANAAALDDADAVSALLRLEVSPNSSDAQGVPAAHRAARARAWSALELLLDAGADQQTVAVDRGTTLLLELASTARTDLVKRCLDQGAPLDMQSGAGQTALMGAIGARQLKTAVLLADAGADPSPVDQLGMTAAAYARMFGFTELAGRLS